MISHSKNFIFIHIPKTAGTSIESALGEYGVVQKGPKNYSSVYHKHVTAIKCRNMMRDEFEKYFRFSSVRNPWDWLVSNYEFNRGVGIPYILNIPTMSAGVVPEWLRNMSFADWLVWFIETIQPSQKKLIADENSNLLVNHIIRFEQLQNDYDELCSILKIPTIKLPKLVATERKPYQYYYDEVTIKLVEEAFADDIHTFKYRFE